MKSNNTAEFRGKRADKRLKENTLKILGTKNHHHFPFLSSKLSETHYLLKTRDLDQNKINKNTKNDKNKR